MTLREPLERHRSLVNHGRTKSVVKTARKLWKRARATVDAKRNWGRWFDDLMTVIMSALFGKKLKKSEIKKKTTTMNQFVFITDENDNFFCTKWICMWYWEVSNYDQAYTIRELSNKIWIFVFHVIFHKIFVIIHYPTTWFLISNFLECPSEDHFPNKLWQNLKFLKN